jgi:signal transduction histidine kinase
VRVTVADRGIGIPPEHRPRLFERFFQAHAGDHRSGMGLGLYLSRQIVERHGGQISAEFPSGGGTRMVVTLPAEAPPDAHDGSVG